MTEKPIQNPNELLSAVRPSKIIYPVIIGLVVVVYMLAKEVNVETFKMIDFTWISAICLCIAGVMMLIRDFAYIVRLKILADDKLSWKKCFRIVMLWEFTSAITPSAIGGTSVAILYVHKEGLDLGRSSAIVMSTSFLDELYFIIMFPFLLFILDFNKLFMLDNSDSVFVDSLLYFAIGGYIVKSLYLLVLSYGLFYNPRGLKWLLLWIFKLPVLRRWKHGVNKAGTDIIQSSREMRKKPFSFWFKAFMATVLSWTARYWLVNVMLIAFWIGKYSFADHLIVFGRQLVMWIMMLVSPTPGGSGFSEWVFMQYFGDFIPSAGMAAALALLWRLISYYPYLFIGVYLLPRWIKKNFSKN